MQGLRCWWTFDARWNVIQVGAVVYVDGEARSEVCREVGPFEDPTEALRAVAIEARDLAARQIPGQVPLWSGGPLY